MLTIIAGRLPNTVILLLCALLTGTAARYILRERGGVVLGTAAADALDEALRDALALLHVEELVLERSRALVDDENFPDCLLHFHFSFHLLP